jgi:amino acid transporter
MSSTLDEGKGKFGTSAVFLTAISTILGAIMFLRFGYAVANVGFMGTLVIILVGHAVTIPTALALAEIATNKKVEGGGEYYIISRSFGSVPGAAIGISLFFSQAISVAFYMIAFAEAFRPLFDVVKSYYGIEITDPRIVSFPALIVLMVIVIKKGADIGMKLLYLVVFFLFVALALFFMGNTGYAQSFTTERLFQTIERPADFFLVFAICFPAFTGMTAGVGLSGDLRDSRRSIPLGTLAATLSGMVIYVAIALKLAVSASPQDLAGDQMAMLKIALWGPIIPIGLACATISSALGSALVAPRTLQALANDQVIPLPRLNAWLAKGKGESNEPTNASAVVFGVSVAIVLLGDVDFVAQVISMFFMVTYGSICMISFLEHFAADPSYRPVFRSRWFISLFGAVACILLMFKMSTPYAILSISVMTAIYMVVSYTNTDKKGLAVIFQGTIFQISRMLQVFLQKSRRYEQEDRWRPSVVCISPASFERFDAFDLLRWLSHRVGFGMYIHYISGYLSRTTMDESHEVLQRLVRLADVSRSNIYVDTIVSPSYASALANVVQLPGISGKENNLILFEFDRSTQDHLEKIINNYRMVSSAGFDLCVLGSSDRGFGYCKEIHIWLGPHDYRNATLMILLGYIILGHPDWKKGEIKLFASFPEEDLESEREHLLEMVARGRLPISPKNVELILADPGCSRIDVVRSRSQDADLIILGFAGDAIMHIKEKFFDGYNGLGNILWVNAQKEIDISREETAGNDNPSISDQLPKNMMVAPQHRA